jgi:hypothetical protein
LILATMLCLSACKKKVRDDGASSKPPPRSPYSLASLSELCEESGEPFPGSPAYEKSDDAKDPSKVVIFTNYLDDKASRWSIARPAAVEPYLASEGEYRDVQLVGCLTLKKKEAYGQCSYYGGTVYIYDMVNDLRVVSARTGKKVASERFELDHKTERCPASYTFASGVNSYYIGADYGPTVAGVLAPLQPDGVNLPKATFTQLDAVCSGSRVPQAAKYSASGTHRVHLAYFPSDEQSITSEDFPSGYPTVDEGRIDPAKFDLVACVRGVVGKKKATCPFTGGKTLELYDGDFEVTLRESRTGKVVETKTFTGSSSAYCPELHKFWGTTDRMMAKIDSSFGKWLTGLGGG